MNSPLLSICVLTYNRAGTLREALDSILPQVSGRPDVEVVISDNASTDGTAQVCGDFSARHSMVRYCPNPKNLGFDGNIVACIEKARGEYISFFSDDDISPPGTYDAVIARLSQDKPSVMYINETPFFHNDPGHLMGPRALVQDRLFERGADFFAFSGPIGLISSLTLRTSEAKRFLDRVVYGRGTAHLDILTRVIFHGKGPFIHAGKLTALARCDYNPWYDRLTFGAMNVIRLFQEMQREGLITADDVRRRTREQVRHYLPSCVINNRCRADGIVPLRELTELYGGDPLFYLLVFPILLVPVPVMRFLGRPMLTFRRFVRRLFYAIK